MTVSASPRVWAPGTSVSVTLRGGYPVEGMIVHACSCVAVILVTRDAGIYERGNQVPVPVAGLEEVTP